MPTLTITEQVVAVVGLSILVCCLWLWTKAIYREIHGQAWLPYELRYGVPWGLTDVLVIATLVIAAQILAGMIWGHWNGQAPKTIESLTPDQMRRLILSSSLANLVAFILGLLYLRMRHATWRDLGIDAFRIREDLSRGIAAFFMFAPPVYMLQGFLSQWIAPEHPLITLIEEDRDPKLLYVAVFAAVIVAPMAEEYFFRVILQGWLENVARVRRSDKSGNGIYRDPTRDLLIGRSSYPDKQGTPNEAPRESAEHAGSGSVDLESLNAGALAGETAQSPSGATPDAELHAADPVDSGEPVVMEDSSPSRWPIVASAAMFAIMHLGHGPAPIALFVLALGLGYLYQRTHRVLPCIVVHALVNTLTLVALGLSLVEPIK